MGEDPSSLLLAIQPQVRNFQPLYPAIRMLENA